jgi:hypothetical protein
MRLCTPALIIVALATPPLRAAEVGSDPHRQAALEFVQLMVPLQSILDDAPATADLLVEQDPSFGPYRDVIVKWARKYMTWETYGPRLVGLYSDAFTEAELRELIAFYKTPTGQHAIKVLPELNRRRHMLAGDIAKEHADEFLQLIHEQDVRLGKEPQGK